MITASFDVNRKLKKIIPKGQVPLSEVSAQLAAIEDYATKNSLTEVCELSLLEDGQSIFKDDIQFGAGNPYVQSVLSVVNHTLETTFKDVPKASKEALINKITEALQQTQETGKPLQTKEKPQPQPDIPRGEPQKETPNISVVQQADRVSQSSRMAYQVAQRKNRNGKRIAFHYQLPSIKVPRLHVSKGILKGILSLALILMLGWLITFSFQVIKHQVQQPPAYETLMTNKDYLKAAKLYPKRRQAIEAKLRNGPKKTLQTFNTHYPSAAGKFDLAFMNHEWSTVVKTNNVTMTKVRKAQLAVAYLKLHEPEPAQRLNLEVNDQKLAGAIALEYIRQGRTDDATTINQKLKSSQLTDLINAGKAYQQAINKYQQEANDQSLSATQRAQAADNLSVWQHNLKTIGE